MQAAQLTAGGAMAECLPRSTPFQPARSRSQARRSLLVSAAAQGKGFSEGSGAKSKAPKMVKFLGEEDPRLAAAAAAASKPASSSDGWFEVPGIDLKSSFVSKPIQPVILATGRAIMLYSVGGQVYCSAANSTAFQYPLADASLLQVKGKPAVEVKLDGTVYDLETGAVLSWCPKDTVLRKVLGTLKDKAEPEDLPVYPVRVKGSSVWVNLSAAAPKAA